MGATRDKGREMKYLLLLMLMGCVTSATPESDGCRLTGMVGFVGPRSERDIQAYQRARYVCATRYSGCLIRFEKLRDYDYHATCGAKRYESK